MGCTPCHLVVKVVSRMVKDEMTLLLSPKQLGYGVRGGAEASVHGVILFANKYGF